MTTIKIVLRKKQNSDGTFPIAVRITKNRKTSFIHLANISPDCWDEKNGKVKKSHPNSVRLNNLIATRYAEISDTALEVDTHTPATPAVDIKSAFEGEKENDSIGKVLFFEQAEKFLATLTHNRRHAEKPRKKYFGEFLKNDKIAMQDITPGTLRQFKSYLTTIRKVGDRTIANYMGFIQSVFSFAADNKLIDRAISPFGKGKYLIKTPKSNKKGISREDIQKLENVVIHDTNCDRARDIWLLSYYFAGMRISDVLRLRWSDFTNMRLHYSMGKNNKPGSLKTPQKALRLLEKYEPTKTHPDDLIFPELKKLPNLKDKDAVEKAIDSAAHGINRRLKTKVLPAAGVDSHVTMHISRHTFATEAGDKIPIQMLQQLYRHSNIETTIGYQANFINKAADDALDAVLNG